MINNDVQIHRQQLDCIVEYLANLPSKNNYWVQTRFKITEMLIVDRNRNCNLGNLIE